MADERKGFIVYGDIEAIVKEMNKEQIADLFVAMLGYFNHKEDPCFTGEMKFAWIPIKQQMDRDREKYETKCKRLQANASKRWNANASKSMQLDANASNTKTNTKTDTDTKTERDTNTNTKAAETATDVSLSLVKYLNHKAGTRHRATEDIVDQVEELISAGYSEEDIRSVIDKKSAEWKNDDRMRPNLRPSVLFGAKFTEYYGALDTGQAAADRDEAERKERARKAKEEQAAREAALEAEYEAGQKRLSPEEVQARLAAISKKTFN